MQAWRNLSIKIRLTILFLMAAIIPSVILGSITAIKSMNALTHRIYNELSSTRDVKKGEIEIYFKTLEKNLASLTQTGDLRYTFAKFDRAFNLGHGTKSDVYKALTVSLQKNMDAIAKQYQLDDYLFIDAKGNIIASHAKNGDLGTNLLSGSLKTTPLAKGFVKVSRTKKPVITDMSPYPPAKGKPRMFMIIPIVNGDDPTLLFDPHVYMGAMAASLPPSLINEILWSGVHLGKTGEIYLVGPDKLMRSDSRLDPKDRSVYTSMENPGNGSVDTRAVREALSGKTGIAETKNYLGEDVISAYTPVNLTTGKPWALITDISKKEAFAPIYAIRKIAFMTGGFLYLMAILIALFAAFNITRPIKGILEDLKAIAAGDLNRTITVPGKDEIGQMAQALKDMLNGVIGEGQSIKNGIPVPFWTADEALKITFVNEHTKAMGAKIGMDLGEAFGPETLEMAQQAIKLGDPVTQELEIGNLVIQGTVAPLRNLKGEITGAMGMAADITGQKKAQEEIENNRQILLKVAKEVQEVANQVASAAEVLSSQSDEIATGAEEQATQANQVAAAVEEMNATIAEVAKNAQKAANRSQEARSVATQGSDVVEKSVEKIQNLAATTQKVAESVEALAEKSREIDKVIDVISDIADQTNLLALNATIEAASAGEAGKGFAVVAGEVKELAKQTAESTESVGEAIEQIQEGIRQSVEMIEETLKEVSEATALAGEAGNSLGEIVAKTGNTAEMVTGIAAAAQEQTAAVGEITRNVDGIMAVSQKTAEGITESARAAKELAALSEQLKLTVQKFNAQG